MTNINSINQDASSAARQAAILIASDFSENSRQAAVHGFRTATAWGAAPHVVHVCRKTADGLSIQHAAERLLVIARGG